ncbi:MFS transporter [Puerhibacterium puerhi]|uniref:MFS transporter n=1 Tax=Puerhibacterium puerhi TaxID=2692623 RepID=UPI0019153A97|nr:MFS transporter [Puerhibacterium puerhi]
MTAATTAPHALVAALSPRAQRVVLAGMVAFISLSAFESLAVSTAMPTVAVALDGLRWYTVAFSASLAASVVGMLTAGPWADRRGPTPPMWAGALTFLAGLLLAGCAPSMGAMLVGRLLQGVGGGLTNVALYVLVACVFPAQRRARVFATFAAAWVLPGVVGPLAAGLVVEHLGWRWVFLGVALLAAPGLLLLRPGLAAARGAAPAVEGDSNARSTPRVPRDGVARDVAGAVLRARRGLGTTVVVRALASAAFSGAEVLLPLVLAHERGLAPSAAGSVLTLHVLGWSAGSWLRGRGSRRPVTYARLGAGLLAAGTVGVALLAVPGVPLLAGAAPWALAGLGMGFLYPTLSMLALELAPPGGQGTASSALQVADALAGALALAVAGQLLWALHAAVGLAAYAACFALAGALALVGAALAGRTAPTPGTAGGAG